MTFQNNLIHLRIIKHAPILEAYYGMLVCQGRTDSFPGLRSLFGYLLKNAYEVLTEQNITN